MENRNLQLKQLLQPGKHVHLVGIGGVSMRPLGLVLQGMGIHVTGSDMNSSVSTDEPNLSDENNIAWEIFGISTVVLFVITIATVIVKKHKRQK